jgi:hypothetical protein
MISNSINDEFYTKLKHVENGSDKNYDNFSMSNSGNDYNFTLYRRRKNSFYESFQTRSDLK